MALFRKIYMNKPSPSLTIALISLCSQGCLFDECTFDSDCDPDEDETAACSENICVYEKKPIQKCAEAIDCGVGYICKANVCKKK